MITFTASQHEFVRRLAGALLGWHVGVTAAILAVGAGAAIFPDLGSRIAPTLGPITHHVALIVALVLTWVLVTVILLRTRRQMETDDLVLILAVAALSMLYLIFLRERASFGDIEAYLEAASAIRNGDPFPERYIYPPLWAVLLAGVQEGLGDRASEIFCFVLNHVSLVAFLPLAVRFMERCGFRKQPATFLVLAAVAINTATARNVAYVQINYLVLDLLLIGVLAPRRLWWLAALSLATGVHLKLLPLIVLPLLTLERRWRLLGGFVVAFGLIFLVTLIPDGLGYWRSFAANLSGWSQIPFRSVSLPGLFENTAAVFGLAFDGRAVARPIQVLLAGFVVWLSWRAARGRMFTSGKETGDGVADGLIPLLFLWPVLSPSVWVHHLVILILPALVVLPHLRTARLAAAFGACWFLVFLFPTVDVYPVSYFRLAGWLGLLWLVGLAVREQSSGDRSGLNP